MDKRKSPSEKNRVFHELNNEYIKKYQLTKDKQALENIIKLNYKLVLSIANRYYRGNILYEDLVQEGILGLVEAANRFDFNKDNRFSTYAYWYIKYVMRTYFYNNYYIMSYSNHIMTKVYKMIKVREQFIQDYNREPTNVELARLSNVSMEYINIYNNVINRPIAIDKSPFETGREDLVSREKPFHEILTNENEERFENESLRKIFNEALRRELKKISKEILKEQQYEVINIRYGLEDGIFKTFPETGKIMGFSRQRVQAVEKEAIRRLRREFNPSWREY